VIAEALRALQRGLVVGFPTDTVYGIGVDPFDEAAMERLFEVKGRPDDKAIPILAADLDGVRRAAVVSDEVAERVARHWPGALTVVLPKADGVPEWVGDPDRGTVAVRIPDHPTALELLRRSGPLAVTSANRSGEPPALDDQAGQNMLGRGVAVYVPGVSPGGRSSTVVDLTGPDAVVLRPGPVQWEDR
jgi:tRNA threonylcarbamoyl adenosine modification protein (Sua5/YciO/YrdC/YwlC family)